MKISKNLHSVRLRTARSALTHSSHSVFPLAQSLSQQGTAHRVKYISEKIPEKKENIYLKEEKTNKNKS